MIALLLLACATGRGLLDEPAAPPPAAPDNARAALLVDALADCHQGRCDQALAAGSDTLRLAFPEQSLQAYLGERYAVLGAPLSVAVLQDVQAGSPAVSVMRARVRFQHGELVARAVFEEAPSGWSLAELDLPVPLGAARPPGLEGLLSEAQSLVDDAWLGRAHALEGRFAGDLSEPTLAAELSWDLVVALDRETRPVVGEGGWHYDRGAWRLALPEGVTLAWARSEGAWRVVGLEIRG
ncbi:MAG: hypothetical protein H6741_00530 [Alphaproteobacteria bacterium]|nr:hypothetical protein [Alphaproteobacteria bacterium]MCB9791190.1 hypothetical protein [Alphaproteobacteria bacterium]